MKWIIAVFILISTTLESQELPFGLAFGSTPIATTTHLKSSYGEHVSLDNQIVMIGTSLEYFNHTADFAMFKHDDDILTMSFASYPIDDKDITYQNIYETAKSTYGETYEEIQNGDIKQSVWLLEFEVGIIATTLAQEEGKRLAIINKYQYDEEYDPFSNKEIFGGGFDTNKDKLLKRLTQAGLYCQNLESKIDQTVYVGLRYYLGYNVKNCFIAFDRSNNLKTIHVIIERSKSRAFKSIESNMTEQFGEPIETKQDEIVWGMENAEYYVFYTLDKSLTRTSLKINKIDKD